MKVIIIEEQSDTQEIRPRQAQIIRKAVATLMCHPHVTVLFTQRVINRTRGFLRK